MYNNFWNSVWTNRFWRIVLHRGTSLGFLILQKIVIHSHVLFFLLHNSNYFYIYLHTMYFFLCPNSSKQFNNKSIHVFVSCFGKYGLLYLQNDAISKPYLKLIKNTLWILKRSTKSKAIDNSEGRGQLLGAKWYIFRSYIVHIYRVFSLIQIYM